MCSIVNKWCQWGHKPSFKKNVVPETLFKNDYLERYMEEFQAEGTPCNRDWSNWRNDLKEVLSKLKPQQQGNQVRANFKQTIYPTYEEHFKKYYPDNWQAILKHDKYRQEYEPMKAQLTAIANQYKNPTISPVFLFRAIITPLGRHLDGTSPHRKLESLKKWIAELNDYKRNKTDVRQEFYNCTYQKDK